MQKVITLGNKGKAGSRTITVDAVNKTIKLPSDKSGIPAQYVYGSMTKGEARRLRKLLAANGMVSVAAISRETPPVKFSNKVAAAKLPLTKAA